MKWFYTDGNHLLFLKSRALMIPLTGNVMRNHLSPKAQQAPSPARTIEYYLPSCFCYNF
jgi:hypothetical protein